MNILCFESLDSTSDHASGLLDQGPQAFAVLARTQTKGRGRSGKNWSSPEGGIYATLVLPSADLGAEKLAHLPLLVACAVAEWLREIFSFRVTLKWPNDLLFATAKLGGILCESSVQGQLWGPVLIGVGINLHQAPAGLDQATISLDQILERRVSEDALDLGRSLVAALHAGLLQKDLLQLFGDYAIEAGQLWKNADGRYARLQKLDSSGHLQVQELESGQIHSLSSVRHEWQWIYQQEQAEPLLFADIGNSLGKLVIDQQPAHGTEVPIFRFRLQGQELAGHEDLETALKKLRLPPGWPVHAIAVRDSMREQMGNYLAGLGFNLVMVPKRAIRVRFDHYRFEELGIDRVAMVEAAHALLPDKNLIVVSAGTAVTVEVLTADGFYQGGYILPGLQTKLNSLHLRTARLPQIYLNEIDALSVVRQEFLGHDTRSAMLRGVLRETQLALKGLQAELKSLSGQADWTLVCTGGDGEFLSQLLEATYLPRLILQGVRMMILGGQKAQASGV